MLKVIGFYLRDAEFARGWGFERCRTCNF